MDSPYKAVNLILNNSDSVLKNTLEIEKLNEKRKYLSDEFYKEALLKVNPEDNILFYISPTINH
jgi:single-stranded DNA-specific DHH superfamily exonuclease